MQGPNVHDDNACQEAVKSSALPEKPAAVGSTDDLPLAVQSSNSTTLANSLEKLNQGSTSTVESSSVEKAVTKDSCVSEHSCTEHACMQL